MASASSRAQHFLECDNCEDRPAQYLCKTCQGHLCEECKQEHKQKRLTKDHETVLLSADHSTKIKFPYCPDHKENRLECFCSPCQIPVCTKCMTGVHNEHSVKDLMTVYKEIAEELQRGRLEIENTLLPAYNEHLLKEETRKENVSKRANEIEQQIEAHAEAIIKRVRHTKEKAIQKIRNNERNALKDIDISYEEIERKIEMLNDLQSKLNDILCSNPKFVYFKKDEIKQLERLRHIPRTYSYNIKNFQPGCRENVYIEKEFGETPRFTEPFSFTTMAFF